MKTATGRLGWTPDVAMKSDPILIELAWEGRREDIELFERVTFAAQGKELPSRAEREKTPAQRFRDRIARHNAAFEARKADAQRRGRTTARDSG